MKEIGKTPLNFKNIAAIVRLIIGKSNKPLNPILTKGIVIISISKLKKEVQNTLIVIK